jgi:hypothetical protein
MAARPREEEKRYSLVASGTFTRPAVPIPGRQLARRLKRYQLRGRTSKQRPRACFVLKLPALVQVRQGQYR